MKKVIFIFIVFVNFIYATPLSQQEINLGNSMIANFNKFIKTQDSFYIRKALKIKKKLWPMLKNKPNGDVHTKTLKKLQVIPIYLQYCVSALLNKDDQMVNACYDNMKKIEPTSKYAATPRDVVLENLVLYLGEKKKEYEKAERVALYTLKLYPNQYPTLYNIVIAFHNIPQSKKDKIFKNADQEGCFYYLALKKSDKLGRKYGYLSPYNELRSLGWEKIKTDCYKYNLNAIIDQLYNKVFRDK